MDKINENFFKLLYGSNYSKLKNNEEFKEAQENFDINSIYDELAQDSDDGTVKKKDLISALEEEIESLGLKTEDFEATDKSKYNTNEKTNISKLIDIFSRFDDESDFSQEDLDFLANSTVNSSGTKITVKDESNDKIKTIDIKRNSKQTITSTSSNKIETTTSSGSKKRANENILKLVYGKNYSKVKNEDESKDFDINEIYNNLKDDYDSSTIDEYDLAEAIVSELYDQEDIDEEYNVEEIAQLISSLDGKDGFSRSDLTKLKSASVSSQGKSLTSGDDKYTVKRDSDGNIDYYSKNSTSQSSSSNPQGYPVQGSPNPNTESMASPPPANQTVQGQQYPTTGEISSNVVSNIDNYTNEKINKDKDKILSYRDTINQAILKINSNDSSVSTTSVQYEGISGYTVDMGNGKYVHFDCENGVLKGANYYQIKGSEHEMFANVTFNSSQLIQTIMIDEVNSEGKKGSDSFAETTGVFDANGNLSLIGYDANENKNSEVVAYFNNNSLSQITLNKNDSAYNPNIETYAAKDNGFALMSQAQTNNASSSQNTAANTQTENKTSASSTSNASSSSSAQTQTNTNVSEGYDLSKLKIDGDLIDSYVENGITYTKYNISGKEVYYQVLSDGRALEITADEFKK